jgi:membrane fusion protein (multidrug efflux system)
MNRFSLLPILFLAACAQSDAATNPHDAAPGPTVPAARLVTAAPATVPEWLTVTGTIVPDDRSDVVPDTSGKVLAVLVERGDHVKKGDPLVRLDTRGATISAAESRANLASLRAQRELAEAECARSQALFDKGAITRQQYDRDRAACTQAQQGVAAAEARARQVGKAIADGVIRAPFAGVVTETWVSPGEWASPGTKLVTVIDAEPMLAELQLPEAAAARVALGQRVEVASVAAPGAWTAASVTELGAEISPQTRALRVDAALPAGHALRAGNFVEARLAVGARSLPAIPRTAAVKRGSTWRVFVAVDGTIEERVVQLGPELDADHVTVARGLDAGAQVVAQLDDTVVDGAEVTP